MYALISNQVVEKYPYSLEDFRLDNPQISLPAKPSDAILEEYGVHPVTGTDIPEVDHTQSVTEGTPAFAGGVWKQVWIVQNRTEAEISSILSEQWSYIRAKRNALLSECDWTQLPDAPVNSAEWASYRQALRDITLQKDPFNISWPNIPE